jgi:hypothetical protein
MVASSSPYPSPYPSLSLNLYTKNIIDPINSAVTTPAPIYTTAYGAKTYYETGEAAGLMGRGGAPQFPAHIHTRNTMPTVRDHVT